MTAAERAERTRNADELCRAALEKALGGRDGTGLSLVAVGGYGRGELAPASDLDVVLVHDDGLDGETVAEVAGSVWYPLWDAGTSLDHSVRALSDVTAAAGSDVRVALGLLDARHLAGDPNVTLRLRTEVLAQWRRDARSRLPELRALVDARAERLGELAHVAVPDVKESFGGLRDATVLKALVATWLVDVPHTDLERTRQQLLDVRDVVQALAGRADRPDRARRLGGPRDRPRAAGRRGRAADRAPAGPPDHPPVAADLAPGRRGPGPAARRPAPRPRPDHGGAGRRGDPRRGGARRTRGPRDRPGPVAPGGGRGGRARPGARPRDRRHGWPGRRHRCRRAWDTEARNLLTRLLAAGPGLLEVWETLEETGALALVLPEWERLRLLPHASVVHRFTVDRHVVETCIEASRLIRRVGRPDVLMVAALLHDIGKGELRDHSVVGEPLAGAVAERWGFDAHETALVRRLVRWHLLLAETATTRDLDDPATATLVAERVLDVETLDLLEVLTEADARATSPKAWTGWRASLVADLARRVRATLPGPVSGSGRRGSAARTRAGAGRGPRGSDRRRAHGRAVRARFGRDRGVRRPAGADRGRGRRPRRTAPDGAVGARLDPGRVRRVGLGRRRDATWTRPSSGSGSRRSPPAGWTRAGGSGRPRPARWSPRCWCGTMPRPRPRSSRCAPTTGRACCTPWCRALADVEVSVRSAHVATLGPQAVDVFYVGEPGAGALGDERAAAAVHAVRRALSPTVTLDV